MRRNALQHTAKRGTVDGGAGAVSAAALVAPASAGAAHYLEVSHVWGHRPQQQQQQQQRTLHKTTVTLFLVPIFHRYINRC